MVITKMYPYVIIIEQTVSSQVSMLYSVSILSDENCSVLLQSGWQLGLWFFEGTNVRRYNCCDFIKHDYYTCLITVIRIEKIKLKQPCLPVFTMSFALRSLWKEVFFQRNINCRILKKYISIFSSVHRELTCFYENTIEHLGYICKNIKLVQFACMEFCNLQKNMHDSKLVAAE